MRVGCETFAYFRQFFVNCNSSALDKTLAIAFFTFLKSVQDCTRAPVNFLSFWKGFFLSQNSIFFQPLNFVNLTWSEIPLYLKDSKAGGYIIQVLHIWICRNIKSSVNWVLAMAPKYSFSGENVAVCKAQSSRYVPSALLSAAWVNLRYQMSLEYGTFKDYAF